MSLTSLDRAFFAKPRLDDLAAQLCQLGASTKKWQAVCLAESFSDPSFFYGWVLRNLRRETELLTWVEYVLMLGEDDDEHDMLWFPEALSFRRQLVVSINRRLRVLVDHFERYYPGYLPHKADSALPLHRTGET